jgi:hypothetical protein
LRVPADRCERVHSGAGGANGISDLGYGHENESVSTGADVDRGGPERIG